MPSNSVRFSSTQPHATNSPSPGGRPPEFGADREDRFGLRREIEGLLRFVIVDPVHPVPVVEERRRSECAVRQEPVEPSVQARWKGGVFLVEVDEIRGACRLDSMAPLLETASGPRLGELLPRKDENDIPSFIVERHSVGKGILPDGPPHINPKDSSIHVPVP